MNGVEDPPPAPAPHGRDGSGVAKDAARGSARRRAPTTNRGRPGRFSPQSKSYHWQIRRGRCLRSSTPSQPASNTNHCSGKRRTIRASSSGDRTGDLFGRSARNHRRLGHQVVARRVFATGVVQEDDRCACPAREGGGPCRDQPAAVAEIHLEPDPSIRRSATTATISPRRSARYAATAPRRRDSTRIPVACRYRRQTR